MLEVWWLFVDMSVCENLLMGVYMCGDCVVVVDDYECVFDLFLWVCEWFV